MQDERGVYYYPFPRNKRVRMYVRKGEGEIEFRLWNQDDPDLWDTHNWVPYDAVVKAQAMYRGGPFDPRQAYDLVLAEEALKTRS